MAYTVEVLAGVEKFLAKLPKKTRHRIYAKIDALATNPRPPQSVKLAGAPHLLRIRSGDYLIVYRVKDDILLILVIRVAHRKEVYRNLPDLED